MKFNIESFDYISANLFMRKAEEGFILDNRSDERGRVLYRNTNTVYSQNSTGIIHYQCENMKGNDSSILLGDSIELCPNGLACIKFNDFSQLIIEIPADSATLIKEIRIGDSEEKSDLTNLCDEDNNILVITPDYPSPHNLYVCAFAHSRNRLYLQNGLKIQVASIADRNYQSLYSYDEISVLVGGYKDLKELLKKKQYKVIITHFVDEKLLQIFDGYIRDEKLIFICHGPETTYRILPNKSKPYFSKELADVDLGERFNLNDYYIKKYSQKENVEWIFVSEWLKNASEKCQKAPFLHSKVIYNTISETLFPYVQKKKEDRKKIIILRKFDNVSYHSVDIAVETILYLSRKKFFNDLEIDIYGDGNYYDTLTDPIKDFSNIHFHRGFVPNDRIKEIYQDKGIILIPSRHDAQAVSMAEAARSGLVVVGSNVTSNPFFMDEKTNHTLADPERPDQLANIIERLYFDEEEFLSISKRQSLFIQSICSFENTTLREIDLIKQKLSDIDSPKKIIKKCEKPILSIVVPAYNVEGYVEKCLTSLLMAKNIEKAEILFVNDGSTDNTVEIARKIAESNNNIRTIDKENGGHGSAINVGLNEANGTYFRIIDGDDWVDGDNLSKLIDVLENETADLILTLGKYEYADKANMEDIINYDMLTEGRQYLFDDLLYAGYGFKDYGPVLSTSTFRTDVLKKAGFKLSEKKPYVDMEFNAFSLRYVETIKLYRFDIYRYFIGREGQTVLTEFANKNIDHHEYIIMNILSSLDEMKDFPAKKKDYVYSHIIALMVDTQIILYDRAGRWEKIKPFLDTLEKWPEAKVIVLDYINSPDKADKSSSIILKEYEYHLENKPIIEDNISKKMTVRRFIRRFIKGIIPYGLLRIYQKKKYPNGIYRFEVIN